MLSSLLVFGGQLLCRRLVGQQQSLIAANPPGGNRYISFAQATQHFCLLTSGHNPKCLAGTIDRRIRQSHSTPALVDSGERHVFIADVEYGISRHERGSVAIRAQTKVHEIQHRRCPCHPLKGERVLSSRCLQVSRFYRHAMNLLRPQRRMLKQTLSQVSKGPIRVSGRTPALVGLKYMHPRPGQIFLSERPQHYPRSVTATNSYSQASTGSERCTR